MFLNHINFNIEKHKPCAFESISFVEIVSYVKSNFNDIFGITEPCLPTFCVYYNFYD